MYRRYIIRKIGNYRGELNHAQDLDLWMRLYTQGYRTDNIDDYLDVWVRKNAHLDGSSLRSAANTLDRLYTKLRKRLNLTRVEQKEIKKYLARKLLGLAYNYRRDFPKDTNYIRELAYRYDPTLELIFLLEIIFNKARLCGKKVFRIPLLVHTSQLMKN